MTIELDQKDLIILKQLTKDGRTTYSQLADQLKLSVPAVKSRIEKLIKIGVIDHIGIYLSPHHLTNNGAALISLKVDTPNKEGIIAQISKYEEIKTIYEALDEYNISIITQHLTNDSIQQLFEKLLTLSAVEKGKITLLTKERLSKPHIIPKSTVLLNVYCEYCGKLIKGDFETAIIEGVTHYLCCKSCLKNYLQWREKNKK